MQIYIQTRTHIYIYSMDRIVSGKNKFSQLVSTTAAVFNGYSRELT